MNSGCWLYMPRSLLSLRMADVNDLVCRIPDGHPLLGVHVLQIACCLFVELHAEEAERALMWAIEKTVGDVKEEGRDNTASNKAIFALAVKIKTYTRIINVPGGLQDFCPESLFKSSTVGWLCDWKVQGHDCGSNHSVIAVSRWDDCVGRWEEIWASKLGWLQFAFVQVELNLFETVHLRFLRQNSMACSEYKCLWYKKSPGCKYCYHRFFEWRS